MERMPPLAPADQEAEDRNGRIATLSRIQQAQALAQGQGAALAQAPVPYEEPVEDDGSANPGMNWNPQGLNKSLQAMGFNSKARERMQTMQRLTSLTDVGSAAGLGRSTNEELERLVTTGAQVTDIASARRNIAGLLTCATQLLEESTYLLRNPEEAQALGKQDTGGAAAAAEEEDGSSRANRETAWNREEAVAIREQLLKICAELGARAGEPKPMNSKRAEAMRCKLEVRLLPTLLREIPRWGEALRGLHAEVLKWRAPPPLLEEDDGDDLQLEAPPAPPPMKEWEAPKEANPAPRDPAELALLRSMGWGAAEEEPGAHGDDDDDEMARLKQLLQFGAAGGGDDDEMPPLVPGSTAPGAGAGGKKKGGKKKGKKKGKK